MIEENDNNKKVRQKENVSPNPGDDIFLMSLPTRKQELADRHNQKETEQIADIKNIIDKRGYSLVRSEEYLSQGDANTVSSDELKQQHELERRRQLREKYVH
jgi:hypothetical protein